MKKLLRMSAGGVHRLRHIRENRYPKGILQANNVFMRGLTFSSLLPLFPSERCNVSRHHVKHVSFFVIFAQKTKYHLFRHTRNQNKQKPNSVIPVNTGIQKSL
jgi:hypothetical protein